MKIKDHVLVDRLNGYILLLSSDRDMYYHIIHINSYNSPLSDDMRKLMTYY